MEQVCANVLTTGTSQEEELPGLHHHSERELQRERWRAAFLVPSDSEQKINISLLAARPEQEKEERGAPQLIRGPENVADLQPGGESTGLHVCGEMSQAAVRSGRRRRRRRRKGEKLVNPQPRSPARRRPPPSLSFLLLSAEEAAASSPAAESVSGGDGEPTRIRASALFRFSPQVWARPRRSDPAGAGAAEANCALQGLEAGLEAGLELLPVTLWLLQVAVSCFRLTFFCPFKF